MLYYKFKNYEEFKDMFGIVKHGNGVCSRKNKILLAYIRNRRLLHEAIETNNYILLHISSMAELKKTITRAIIISGHSDMSLRYVLEGYVRTGIPGQSATLTMKTEEKRLK